MTTTYKTGRIKLLLFNQTKMKLHRNWHSQGTLCSEKFAEKPCWKYALLGIGEIILRTD